RVVLVDVHAARPAKLLPLIDDPSVLIEDLDAVVPTVGHEDPSSRIHRHRVRRVELAGPFPALAPRLDERSVFGELHDPADGGAGDVAVCDEDVAVAGDDD